MWPCRCLLDIRRGGEGSRFLLYDKPGPWHLLHDGVVAVITDLREASSTLEGAFTGLTPADWRRTGIYNWPERAERDMGWLARHTVHETIHHLDDITRGLEQLQQHGRGQAHPTP